MQLLISSYSWGVAWISRLASVIDDPSASDELRVATRVFWVTLVLGSPLIALIGVVYALYGLILMASFLISQAVVAVVLAALYHRLRRGIEWFGFIAQAELVASAFVVVLLSGGLYHSGGLFVFGLMGPLYALAFPSLARAIAVYLVYLVTLVVAAVLQPWLVPWDELGTTPNLVLSTLHFVLVMTFIFITLFYFVKQRNLALELLKIEQNRSESLLLNILPKDIAAILKTDRQVIADELSNASVLFADLVGFTPLSAGKTPVEIVGLLNEVFSAFDSLVEEHGLEKIKTIGDCYMAAGGVPQARDDHAQALVSLALDMRGYLLDHDFDGIRLDFRIGINSGPLVAGVIGKKKFIYDLWGDTVNTASRMESHGSPGRIQISRSTYELIEDDFLCSPRGKLNIKGKGDMEVWWVESRKELHVEDVESSALESDASHPQEA